MRVRLGVLLALCLALMPALAAAQQTGTIVGKVLDTGGLVLPGVTVEAKSNVLPDAARDGHGRRGRVPDARVAAGHVHRRVHAVRDGHHHPAGRGSARAGHHGRREDVGAGRVGDGRGHRGHYADDRAGLHGHQERRVLGHDPVPAGRPGLPGSAQAHSRRRRDRRTAPAGRARADRPGQRLQVRRRQRDAAALRHAVGGAGVPRHRRSDDDQGRREGGRLRSAPAGSRSTRSASPARTASPARSASSSRATPWPPTLQSGSASRYKQTLNWFNASVGGPVVPNKLFFYGSYYRPERSRDNRSNLYGELPDYNSTRNEGFGKLTFTPTSQILINGTWRQSDRDDKSDLFGQAVGADDRHRQRIVAEDRHGRRVVGDQLAQLRLVQVHALREPERGPAGLHRRHRRQHGRRHASSTSPTSTRSGCSRCPSPLAGQDASTRSSSPTSTGTDTSRRDGVKTGGGVVGYGTLVRQRRLLPRVLARSRYNLSLGATMRHDLHVGPPALQRLGGAAPELQRVGLDQRAGRPHGRRLRRRRAGAARTTSRPSSSRRRAPSRRFDSDVQVAELRGERHDSVQELVLQRRPAHQQRHPLRAGSQGRPADAVRFRRIRRDDLQDVRRSRSRRCSSPASAPRGPTTARTPCTPATRSTPRRPVRCRAPRRGPATWPSRSTRTSTRTACSTASRRTRPRRASSS